MTLSDLTVRAAVDAVDPATLAQLDRDHLIHPHAVIGAPLPPLVITRGQGARVWDADGRQYVDGTSGLWQCPVGHGRAELAEAAAAQMRTLEFYSSFVDYSNPPSILLAQRLLALAPAGLERVFFTNGGSEGNETAIKLARLAHHRNGHPERTVVLARNGGYHGVSSGALTATGLPALREGYGPLLPDVEFIERPHGRPLGPEATNLLVADLERRITEIGPERIAAFIGEPVLGVGGMVPPPEGYWPRVQEVLRRYGILLIIDEIVTAFGRSGHWFACERYGIEPDMVVLAKGISSGYIPMGAVLVGQRVLQMADGVRFLHGFTYNGHPVGCAVALANIDIIEREGLVDRANVLGRRLLAALAPLQGARGVIEVRGVGLMVGIEMDADAAWIQTACRADGVLVRASGNNVVLSPPLVITEDEIDHLAEVLVRHITAL